MQGPALWGAAPADLDGIRTDRETAPARLQHGLLARPVAENRTLTLLGRQPCPFGALARRQYLIGQREQIGATAVEMLDVEAQFARRRDGDAKKAVGVRQVEVKRLPHVGQ